MYLYETPAVLRGSSGAMTDKCSKKKTVKIEICIACLSLMLVVVVVFAVVEALMASCDNNITNRSSNIIVV